jgi:hypothetical protein
VVGREALRDRYVEHPVVTRLTVARVGKDRIGPLQRINPPVPECPKSALSRLQARLEHCALSPHSGHAPFPECGQCDMAPKAASGFSSMLGQRLHTAHRTTAFDPDADSKVIAVDVQRQFDIFGVQVWPGEVMKPCDLATSQDKTFDCPSVA